VIKREELASKVERVLQRRRTGQHEADALGHRGRCRSGGERLEVLGGLVRPGGWRAEVQAVCEEECIEPSRSAVRARSMGLRRTPAVL